VEVSVQLEKKAFKSVGYNERFKVQQLFIDKARQDLPFNVGLLYATVVEKCLSGQFEVEGSSFDVATHSSYQEQVRCSVVVPIRAPLTLLRFLKHSEALASNRHCSHK
jgi:hypothetical protein